MTTSEVLPSKPAAPPLQSADRATITGSGGKRRRRHRMRRAIVRVHRWLGLTLAVWVALMAVTGFTLVFQDQINAWLHPEWYRETPGDLGPQAALDAARTAHPDWTVYGVTLPALNDGVYSVGMQESEHEYHDVFIDPGTATITGAHSDRDGFVSTVYRLHDSLLVDEVFGVGGTTIVGWLAVVWLAVLLSGSVAGLTQQVKGWRARFRVRRDQSRFRFSFDLHRTLGLIMIVPLVLVVLTGINFQFYEQLKGVWDRLTPSGSQHIYEPPADLKSSEGAGRPLDADALAGLLRRRHPDSTVTYIGTPPPGEPTATVTAYLSQGYDPYATQRGYAGNGTVVMDQYTGEELWVGDPRAFSAWTQFYDQWTFPLHAGSFGRTPTRLVWLLLAAGTSVSAATGLIMWKLRRRTKQKRDRLQAERAKTPVA